MEKGSVDFLPTNEVQFWNDLIDKYLYVLKKDVKKEKEDAKKLKDLRNLAVFAFFMLNALFVLVIFMLQFNVALHITWPLGGDGNEPVTLQPIGMAFIFVFGTILILQFIAMLIHRFGTLEHLLSTTQISWFKSDAPAEDKHADPKTAVQLAKHLQDLRGADGDVVKERDLMEEKVGRRKTVRNIHNTHQVFQKKQAPRFLGIAFKWRMSKLRDEDVTEACRKLSHRRRETVSRMVVTGRKSVMKPKERRRSQLRRQSSMGHMNNMRPGDMLPVTQL